MATKKIRVAAVQLGAGGDVQENLKTCLRMIDEAAKGKPDLMVLPEFCNHFSWYDDKAHCYRVSVPLNGDFMNTIGAKAKEHHCYIAINCTVQREDETATGTSVLFSPDGKIVADTDKQVLMGHENDFLVRAKQNSKIVETPIGRIGLYACMDGVINETPRGIALRGAQILCNSLNSFARDEASLHVPVRAPENRVFIVAANKVEPLIPEALLEPVSQMTSIPLHFLHGAGESQIVAPDGTVLAKAPLTGEAVVFADIDVSEADNKARPDGTNVFKNRRPELYKMIGDAPKARDYTKGAPSVAVATYQPKSSGAGAIQEAAAAVARAAKSGSKLVVLPELFCFEKGLVKNPAQAVARSDLAIAVLSAACANSDCYVATSLVDERNGAYRHVGVLINSRGVISRQPQLHRSERHAKWATKLGEALNVIQLPWGRFAMVVGDDSIYPETFRLASLQNCEVVAVPTHIMEKWEVTTGLLERSAENRMCLVVASRPTKFGASLITTLWEDFTIMTPWKNRPFDGNISYPILTRAKNNANVLTQSEICPKNAENRFVSKSTDVVDGRPWFLAEAITAK